MEAIPVMVMPCGHGISSEQGQSLFQDSSRPYGSNAIFRPDIYNTQIRVLGRIAPFARVVFNRRLGLRDKSEIYFVLQ